MIRLTVDEIANITRSQLFGDPACLINQICTDTREIDSPSGCLFIALKGPSHDGHRFLEEAYACGIRSFLVDKLPHSLAPFQNGSFIVAQNTLKALQDLASWHRSHFSGQLIAITGSNGKTIIKEWLSQLLQSSFSVTKSPKSYNSQLGVPLSVLNISGDENFAILEAGISRPGEMVNLQKILNPDIGIISNIGDAHQENFSSLSQKTKEKLVLFRHCKSIYFCYDHELIRKELKLAHYAGQLFSWSRYQPSTLQIKNESINGSICNLVGLYQNQEVHLSIPFTDPASIENLIQIWLFLLTIGFDQSVLQTQIIKLEPIRMRLEQKAGINRCALINDYYNSDILSLKIALDLLFQQTSQSRKTIILSDIQQTGLSEHALYVEINRLLSHRPLSRLIGIGPAINRNRKLFTCPLVTYPSTAEFLSQLNPDDFQDEAILLKGARAFAFERISNVLEARIHTTTLEIRMNDVHYNLEQYRRIIGPDVRIMVMVKAFSYGSGGIEMVKFLSHERVDYLGVAIIDEGIEIRRAGIKTPTIIMNSDFQQSDLIIDHHLEPEVYNWSGLTAFCKAVRTLGLNHYPIHIKLDTGMHRLGFDHSEVTQLAEFLCDHHEIFVKSSFSHLATSDDPENDDFTHLQIHRFSTACDILEQKIGYRFIRHILNSAGIERFPEAHFDMVRLGIGLYGFCGSVSLNLRPIATLRTVISQIHALSAGESVGYGRTTILDKPTLVGIIPIGYADGIDRRLGNGQLKVLVHGQLAPTIGNICMDMAIIDLSGLAVSEGDEVVIFGPNNPLTEIADTLHTIPYEVLTSIPPRVKRIFQFD